jgi:hypothetical protein
MHHIILSSMACLAVPHFPTSHEQHDFFKRRKLNIKCIFLFSLQILSETFLIHRRNEWDMIKTVYWFSWKLPIIHIRFESNFNFLNRFLKNTRIKFHYNPSSGSRVVPCGQTDMAKLVVIFHIFVNTPKNVPWILESPPKVSLLLSHSGGACVGKWPWEPCRR